MQPLISICIPTYERVHFLKQLIENIESQTFRDYEIIITDNSITDEVKDYIISLENNNITYIKNSPSLSMGENWNKCMSLAKGSWLKMMHDDDYFIDNHALYEFAEVAKHSPPAFIFGRLCFYDIETKEMTDSYLEPKKLERIRKHPVDLIGMGNVIGNPCNTLIHKEIYRSFTPTLKWIIDFEGYIKIFKKCNNLVYIDKILVKICHHPTQVTRAVFLNKSVEVPENNYLFNTYFPQNCKWFYSFDYFWRKSRNLRIKSVAEYKSYLPEGEQTHVVFEKIISFQNKIPYSILKTGVFSKAFSFLFWMLHIKLKSIK